MAENDLSKFLFDLVRGPDVADHWVLRHTAAWFGYAGVTLVGLCILLYRTNNWDKFWVDFIGTIDWYYSIGIIFTIMCIVTFISYIIALGFKNRSAMRPMIAGGIINSGQWTIVDSIWGVGS